MQLQYAFKYLWEPKGVNFCFFFASKQRLYFTCAVQVCHLNWVGPLLLPRQSLRDGDCDESLDCKY